MKESSYRLMRGRIMREFKYKLDRKYKFNVKEKIIETDRFIIVENGKIYEYFALVSCDKIPPGFPYAPNYLDNVYSFFDLESIDIDKQELKQKIFKEYKKDILEEKLSNKKDVNVDDLFCQLGFID